MSLCCDEMSIDGDTIRTSEDSTNHIYGINKRLLILYSPFIRPHFETDDWSDK